MIRKITFYIGTYAVAFLPCYALANAELEARISELEGQIIELQSEIETLETNAVLQLDGRVGRIGDYIQFSGVNVQVTNGLGATDSKNAVGNVLVGYDEPTVSSDDVSPICSEGNLDSRDEFHCLQRGELWSWVHKSGSHNLVAGVKNNYAQYGGLIGGTFNSVIAAHGSITAGTDNLMYSDYGHISGGYLNTVTRRGVVVGGTRNSTGPWPTRRAVVLGGFGNLGNGYDASVVGGRNNTTYRNLASILGGANNHAGGQVGITIAGGRNNVIAYRFGNITHTTISGGQFGTFDENDPTNSYNWKAGDLVSLDGW
ncbi:MAG: hypothetical protein AAF438_10120 [Pseudomonadota bacterium]